MRQKQVLAQQTKRTATAPENVPFPDGLATRKSPHGRITAVSMMKDEGPFLLEWVAHHLAIGFTDIVVYTNDCTDGTDKMLMRLEEMGLAYHRVNDIPAGLRPQPSAIKYAQNEPLVGTSDWVMVFDADEFLCIKLGDGSLDGLISAAKKRGANGIVVTWRIFGSGGVEDWSRDPVTEQYLRAAPPDWNKGWGVKTLFQYDPQYWKLGIHRPKMKNKWLKTDYPETVHWVNGSGLPMEEYFKFRGWRSIARTIGYDWAQMNHYAIKSVDSYAIRKFRGNVNFKKDKYNADYWALQDRNEVRDDTMLRYSEARRQIFEALLRDSVLHDLHFAALQRAEAQLAEFKQTDAYRTMAAGLKKAGGVPITAVAAKPPKARDPKKIEALMSRVEKLASEKQAARRRAALEDGEARNAPLYVPEPLPMAADAGQSWHENHEIRLPGDPNLFTMAALGQIAEGKFERALARNLPKILSASTSHAEFGAGCGFLAAHLSKLLPQMAQFVTEANRNLHDAISRIWALNGVTGGSNLVLRAGQTPETLPTLLTQLRPTSLALGDPELDPAQLAMAFTASGIAPPSVLYLTGRAQARFDGEPDAYEELFCALGLNHRLPFDFTIAVPAPV
ncbi:MAG: glycosyltransferase family 2 protein [Paracoccaceae bacterium]